MRDKEKFGTFISPLSDTGFKILFGQTKKQSYYVCKR